MATGPKWNGQRGCWYVRFWDGGRWRKPTVARGPRGWRPGDPEPDLRSCPPEAFAEKARLEERERRAREMAESGVPSSLVAFLGEHVEGYACGSTKASCETTVRQFLGFCAEHGVTDVGQVSRRLCERWINHLAPEFGINTVERKKSQIAAAWGARKKRGEIAVNPWEGVKAKGKPVEKGRGSWTPKQFAILLGEAPPLPRPDPPPDAPKKKVRAPGPIKPWLGDLLVFGVNTGLRIGAVLRLEWRDIVPPETPEQRFGFIRVRAELDKAKVGYKVPLSRRAHELLERKRSDPDRHPRYIITSSRGKPIANRSVSGTAIKRRARSVGLPWPTSPNHHFRRTFGRWAHFGHLNGVKVPIYTVMRWLGHHTIRTTMVYLDIQDEESAAFMVPDEAEPACS